MRLTDFGLSKEGVTLHAKGAHSFCGTPEYLAPGDPGEASTAAPRTGGRSALCSMKCSRGCPSSTPEIAEKLFEGIKHGELGYPGTCRRTQKQLPEAMRCWSFDPAARLGSGPGGRRRNTRAHVLREGRLPLCWMARRRRPAPTVEMGRWTRPSSTGSSRACRSTRRPRAGAHAMRGLDAPGRHVLGLYLRPAAPPRRDAEERAALMERKFPPAAFKGRPACHWPT